MKPRIPLHDPRFKYVDSASTDIRKTFAKARREIERARAQPLPITNVAPIRAKKRASA